MLLPTFNHYHWVVLIIGEGYQFISVGRRRSGSCRHYAEFWWSLTCTAWCVPTVRRTSRTISSSLCKSRKDSFWQLRNPQECFKASFTNLFVRSPLPLTRSFHYRQRLSTRLSLWPTTFWAVSSRVDVTRTFNGRDLNTEYLFTRSFPGCVLNTALVSVWYKKRYAEEAVWLLNNDWLVLIHTTTIQLWDKAWTTGTRRKAIKHWCLFNPACYAGIVGVANIRRLRKYYWWGRSPMFTLYRNQYHAVLSLQISDHSL